MAAGKTAAFAPGRVELLGNHTDYNQGVVLGAAIDRGINVTGDRRDDGVLQIRSPDFGKVEIPLSELRPLTEGRWANYALGVVRELIDLGVPVNGFHAEVTGDIPIGAGLSSSAAFELATALFLLKLFPRESRRAFSFAASRMAPPDSYKSVAAAVSAAEARGTRATTGEVREE